MKIAFDLDETLVYGDIIAEAGRQLGIQCSNKNVTTFDLSGIPKPIKQRAIELFSSVEYAVYKKKFFPGIFYFLDWCSPYHEIHIITSRPAILRHPTINMFRREGLNLSNIDFHFPNSSKEMKVGDDRPSKLDVFNQLSLDMYFDDSIEYCKEAITAGIEQVFLISNKNTTWNHKKCDQRIRRIKSVVDIEPWEFNNGI